MSGDIWVFLTSTLKNILYYYCIFFISLSVISWRDEWAIIIGPNVPVLRFRGDFPFAHRKPALLNMAIPKIIICHMEQFVCGLRPLPPAPQICRLANLMPQL